MWMPKTEEEILQAISNKSIEETSIFDAKKELGANNKEIAKDLAAMANYGGVILYGLGEDENSYPTITNPIPLAGQPERIALIAQTGIVESLKVIPYTIQSAQDPALGYIVVMIPPSERAPHMVEVKGENRYYGRTAKGNTPLSEGEVARLYERRQKWAVDRDALLNEEIERIGHPSEPGHIYLYMLIRPGLCDEELLSRIADSNQAIPFTLTEFIDKSRVVDRLRAGDDFYTSGDWKQQIEGLSAILGNQVGPDLKDTFKLEVDFDGTIHLFLGEGARFISDDVLFRARPIAMYILSLLSFASKVYDKTRYIGLVDICMALEGLKGSLIIPQASRHYSLPLYERNHYRKTTRISAFSLGQNYEDIAKALLLPLSNAMTQGIFNPFVD